MLDLNSRVHLDEDMFASILADGVNQELNCAGILVADGFCEGNCIAIKSLSQVFVDKRCRCDLDNLLVSSLHRAIALKQVHNVAKGVSQNLNFDVTWANNGLLQEDASVAK